MANVTKNNTHLFTGTGELKFSDLRSAFKETSSGTISAKELLRDTSIDSLNPIVPNCTENNGISAANDLSVSSFRNSIKYYRLYQTGTIVNFDIHDPGYDGWNNNLSKNIVKTIVINGDLGSNQSTKPAASLEGEARNLTISIESGWILGAGGRGGPYPGGDRINAHEGGVGEKGGDALYINNTANELWFTSDGSYSTDRPEVENFANIISYDAAGNPRTDKTFNIKNKSGVFEIISNQNSEGLSIGEKLYIKDEDLGGQGAPDIEIIVAAVNIQWVNVYTNSAARIWGGGGGGGQGGTGQTGGNGGGTKSHPGGIGGVGGYGGRGADGRGYNNSNLNGDAGLVGTEGSNEGLTSKTWRDAKPAHMNDSSGEYYPPTFTNFNTPSTHVTLRMKGSGWQSTWLHFKGGDKRNNYGEAYRDCTGTEGATTKETLFNRHEYNDNPYVQMHSVNYNPSKHDNVYESHNPWGQINYNNYCDLGWYNCGSENTVGEKDILWHFSEMRRSNMGGSASYVCQRDGGGQDCNGEVFRKTKDDVFQSSGQNVTGHVAGLNWDTKTFSPGTGGRGGNGGDGGAGATWGQKGYKGELGTGAERGNSSSTGFFLKTKNSTRVDLLPIVKAEAKETDEFVHNYFTASYEMSKNKLAKIRIACENDGSMPDLIDDYIEITLELIRRARSKGARWRLGPDAPFPRQWRPNVDYRVTSEGFRGPGQLRVNSSNNKILEWDDRIPGQDPAPNEPDWNDLVVTTWKGYFKQLDNGEVYWRHDSDHWAWGLYGIDNQSGYGDDGNYKYGDVDSRLGEDVIQKTLQENTYYGPLYGETIQKGLGPAEIQVTPRVLLMDDLRKWSNVLIVDITNTDQAEWIDGQIPGFLPTGDSFEGAAGGDGGAAIDGRYFKSTGSTGSSVIKGTILDRS